MAGPYLPQFEIYWRKLDPEDSGKVKEANKQTNKSPGRPYVGCSVPQILRALRPDTGQGNKQQTKLLETFKDKNLFFVPLHVCYLLKQARAYIT